MLPWIRRLITVLAVALLTAGSVVWWLYDGDLQQGVAPVVDDLPAMPGVGALMEAASGNDAPPDVLPEETE